MPDSRVFIGVKRTTNYPPLVAFRRKQLIMHCGEQLGTLIALNINRGELSES